MKCDNLEIVTQKEQQYAVITIREPFSEPFTIIPSVYKTLMIYMEVNSYKHKGYREVMSCLKRSMKKTGFLIWTYILLLRVNFIFTTQDTYNHMNAN